MSDEDNPFDHYRPADPAHFLDRTQQRRTLAELLEKQGNVLLYGPRRRGKTSLLLRVLADLKGTTPLYADATRMRNPGDLGDRILRGLSGLGLAKGRRLLKWVQDRASELAVDVTVGKAGLTFTVRRAHERREALLDALEFLESLGQAQGVRFTVCIDEFQVVMEDPALVAALRSVAQVQRHVNYVLSGSEPAVLQALNQDKKSPFYNQLTEFAVAGITIGDLRSDVERRFGGKMPDAAAHLLDDAVGDNTLRLIQVLRHAWGMGKDLSETAIQDAIAAAILENGTEYERLLAPIKPGNQRQVLFALAEDQPKHLTGTAFLKKHAFGTPSHVKRAVDALRRHQILDESNKFQDPLFRLYLLG